MTIQLILEVFKEKVSWWLREVMAFFSGFPGLNTFLEEVFQYFVIVFDIDV